MSKKMSKTKNLKPEQNEFFGGIVQSYEPELVLASPRLVKTVVNELEKLRADLIGLSDLLDSVVDFYPRCRIS